MNASDFVDDHNFTSLRNWSNCVDPSLEKVAIALHDAFIYLAVEVGIPGNILSAIIWLRRHIAGKHSSAVYLSALAVNDLIFLVAAFICISCREVIGPCPCLTFLVESTSCIESLLVLGFSVERAIAVLRPLQANAFCTWRRATIVVVIMSFGVLTAQTIRRVVVYFHPPAFPVFDNIFAIIFGSVVPVTVLIINVAVVREMRRASNNAAVNLGVHQHHQSTSSNSAVPTVMLVTTSLVYVLLNVPTSILAVVFSLIPYIPRCYQTWERMVHIAYKIMVIFHGLRCLMFAYNFFVYVITGKQFRCELRQLFRLCSSSSTSSPAAAAGAQPAAVPRSRQAPAVTNL